MKNSYLFIAAFLLYGVIIEAQTTPSAISWHVPEDGGTPRDPKRIQQISPNEFHIQAAFEDGTVSVLKHAVSRMDLICRNSGSKTMDVLLRIDLSGDGKRTDFDNKAEAGMQLRDFLFIQKPGEPWLQVNGRTEGWVSIIKIEVPPGDTKVGLSPWYTYSDYLSFVNSLPENQYLKKQMIGKSEGNREHWELTITDTSVNAAQKQRIFWKAREHAYETYSSFAMEGLVPFLLSEEAAGFRKRYIISIHPMTNIDGVALGYEYRGGYDLPDPRKIASGQLTFAAADRLRADYAVAWHNWVAPRDRNVVFYTDGDQGKPTPRAWLRFTQLFPTLRSAGHRWKDEATPLKYNWEGRTLGLHNIHQYTMKQYGTRIWGWEMPWWNFKVEDARNAGAAFARALLTTFDELRAGTVPPSVERPLVETPQFSMQEFQVKGNAVVKNPFKDAMLVGEFTSLTGKLTIVDGFYDGGDDWKLRFTPDEQGEWSYQLRGEGVKILQHGKLRCVAPKRQGFIRIHPQNPYAFAHFDSTAFFPMGDTSYGLYDDSHITQTLRTTYLTTRRKQGFNFVRMEVGHSHSRAQINPKFWAWGGTANQPDLDKFNPDFFKGLDSLLLQMRDVGMNLELILLNFYRLPFTDTKLWTPERERLWLHYLLARYGAFENIFMWTISNEYETHPDGIYRLDSLTDVKWAIQTAQFIKENDPFHHLVTVHPVISSSVKGMSPKSSIELPWRIGGFYGKETAIDVLSQQTGQTGEGVKWNETCQCYEGDDPQLTESIKVDRVYKKPVINTENGYEFLTGYPTMRKQVHHTDKVRRSSWRIACAGGYFASGFSGTIGHGDIWNKIDSPNRYPFELKDEGAGAQLGYLYKFFTSLPFWKMQPFKAITGNAVALAEEGKVYAIYLPHGGTVALKQPVTEKLQASWFNPRTGKMSKPTNISPNQKLSFTAPGAGDWALLLRSTTKF